MNDPHILWRHALGAFYVIFGAWIVLTILYYGAEWAVEAWWGPHSVPWWAEGTRGMLENLQSEAWQVGFAAWAFKHFLAEGSPESKDTG